MDRDQETLAVEAMHLDQPVAVGRSAVDDQEDEAVVVLDLRALLEMLRVLDREWMKPEGVAQDLEVVRPRPIEVEPEEVAVCEQVGDGLPVEVNLPVTAGLADVADRSGSSRRERGEHLARQVLSHDETSARLRRLLAPRAQPEDDTGEDPQQPSEN